MKPSPYHKLFLEKRPYNMRLKDRGSFTEEEKRVLYDLGSWMEALERKYIEPETQKQREFVEFCAGDRDPTTLHERLWHKLKESRKFENPSSRSINDYNSNAIINVTDNGVDWWSNPNR